MRIHFSIDDVFETLRWCWENEPESIFDMDFYGMLRKWHELYGLKCNLYAFYTKNKDFELGKLQKKYRDELNVADWLMISYHGIYSKGLYEDNSALFASEWNKTLSVFPTQDRPHMSRFHCWNMPYCTEGELTLNGIKGLLTPVELGRNAYWLDDDAITQIDNRKEIYASNILFWKTDVRWDSLTYEELVGKYEILMNLHPEKIVMFGHEWSFSRQKDILERFINMISIELNGWEL